MTKRTVKDLDVAGKKVIVRCDFNVPRKDGVITDDNRIVMALPTIKYLVENKAKVILMSHLGKVKTEEDKAKNNLECVAVRLQELLPDVKVTFCPVTRGEELENAVNALADGEIVLMQNTRYEKGESKNDPELGAYWASLGEVFVEDAFGSVHRAHASTVGIPTNIKENGLGFLVEKEVTMLGKAVDEPAHPFVAIIGGSKVSSKIDVVDNLLKKADKVIIGGGMAYTFSKAMGGNVGTSLLEEDYCQYALDMLKKAEDKGIFFQVELPEKIICEHDKNWMCEALYNVFDNAVKYSKSNSTINITMKQTEMFYKIQIRDYGIGIRDGEENKIFQRFYRGEQARG